MKAVGEATVDATKESFAKVLAQTAQDADPCARHSETHRVIAERGAILSVSYGMHGLTDERATSGGEWCLHPHPGSASILPRGLDDLGGFRTEVAFEQTVVDSRAPESHDVLAQRGLDVRVVRALSVR